MVEDNVKLVVNKESVIRLVSRSKVKRTIMGIPLLVLLLGLLLVGGVTAGLLIYNSYIIKVSVNDPFSMETNAPLFLSLYGGEVVNFSIITYNNAKVSLNQSLIIRVSDLSNNLLDNNKVKLVLENFNKSVSYNSVNGLLNENDNLLNSQSSNAYRLIVQFSPDFNNSVLLNITQNKGVFSF